MRLESRARRAFIAKGLGLVGVVSLGVALFLIAAPNRADQPPGIDLSISLDDDILLHGFDFDGDGSDDFLHTFPMGEPNLRGQNPDIPGEVWIRSSLNSPGGGLPDVYYRLVGPRGKDRFGASAAPLGDINFDGRADLIVGAPGETHADPQNPNANNLLGRAYVYFGRNKVLSNAQASAPRNWQPDLILQSPHPDLDEQFGIRVGRLFDFDGDGIEDIRVRSHVPHRAYPARTYIFSGATGEAIITFIGSNEQTFIGNNEQALFWDPLPGDANHNLAVDMTDFHIVVRDLGKSGEPGSIAGDVIRDGVVNILDMLAVLDRLGTTIFDTEVMAQAAAGGCCSSPGCALCLDFVCCYDAQGAFLCGGAGCPPGSTSTTSTSTSTRTTSTETTSTSTNTETTSTSTNTETTSTSTNTLTTSTLTTSTITTSTDTDTEPEPPDPLLCDLDIDSDNIPGTAVGLLRHDWLEDTEAKWIVWGGEPAELYTTPIASPATHWSITHHSSVEVYFDEALFEIVDNGQTYNMSYFTTSGLFEMTLWVKGITLGDFDTTITITYVDNELSPPADPCSDSVLVRVVALVPTDIDVDSNNDGFITAADDSGEHLGFGKIMVLMADETLQEPTDMVVSVDPAGQSVKWRMTFGSNIAIVHSFANNSAPPSGEFVASNVWYFTDPNLLGSIWHIWPLATGGGTIRMEVTAANETGWKTLGTDTVAYTIFGQPFNTIADLDIDSDNDGSTPGLGIHEAIEDLLPGKVIAFNNDDDDLDVKPDYLDEDGTVPGEDDLVPLQVTIDPGTAPFVMFQLLYDSSIVKVWSPVTLFGVFSEVRVFDGQTYFHIPSGHAEVPFLALFSQTFMVEGIAPGSSTAALSVLMRVNSQVVNSDSVSATVVELLDLDIDSDNNNDFASPDRSPIEEDLEFFPAEAPGKLLFAGVGDTDGDGVPDYADGMVLSGFDPGPAGTQFVPLVLEFPDIIMELSDPFSPGLRIDYDLSDPEDIQIVGTPPGASYTRPPDGTIRIWTKDGDQLRDQRFVEDGGDLIDPDAHFDRAQLNALRDPSGLITLYVEGVRNTSSPDFERIYVTSALLGGPPAWRIDIDSVKVSVLELEVNDLRHWGSTWDETNGPGISNPDQLGDDLGFDTTVDGAITDGASICLLRIQPWYPEINDIWPNLTVGIVKTADESVNRPVSVGSFKPTHDGVGIVDLPDLPLIDTDPNPSIGDISTGMLFYVPPDIYLDPNVVISSQTLNSEEMCPMTFQLNTDGVLLSPTPFVLRRPPLVLVHGIMSGPETWDSDLWDEEDSVSGPMTRLYLADWGATGSKGYTENYFHVAKMIDDALEEYRSGDDNGHSPSRSFSGLKYAATRADVVGHSQGGQITRWYIADGMPGLVPREGWIAGLTNSRNENGTDGRWPFLRNNNFGAGSIRRFITVGSPFKGSPWATFVVPLLKPGNAGNNDPPGIFFEALVLAHESGEAQDIAPLIDDLLFNPDGTYNEPTCAADLSEGSEAQSALEAATFPSGHKQIKWFPLVGIATDSIANAPMDGILWELLFTFVPFIPNGIGSYSPLSPNASDLLVPHCSQRNSGASCDPEDASSPFLPGEIFAYTAHVNVPGVLVGETNSQPIRDRAVELLYGWGSEFNISWSLGN